MRQTYILPTPDGWAVNTWGDEVIPDDSIVPLPLTELACYDKAYELVKSLPIGAGLVDGWASVAQLAELEPSLLVRCWTPEQFAAVS